MIEIAFDSKKNKKFNGKAYPFLAVPNIKEQSFEGYLAFALDALHQFDKEPYLLTEENAALFSTNKLALAFFVASNLVEAAVDCVVFKTENPKEAYEAYKPYIALSIGIKYALRLSTLEPSTVYKELTCLNYLNFSVKENYAEKTISYETKTATGANVFETHSIFDALVYVSTLKILSLCEFKEDLRCVVHITNQKEIIKPLALVQAILKNVSPYINI